MGSVTSAFTRTRNALVKVGSEPENHESERTRSAPESDRAKKKSARINASSQTGRLSSRTSLSEVLNRPDSGGGRQSSKKKTSEGQQSGRSSTFGVGFQSCYCNSGTAGPLLLQRQAGYVLLQCVGLPNAICTSAISRIYLKFSSCSLQRNTANTLREIKCIHLMNADRFEDEPQCNISLLSTRLFDVCGAPDS